MATNAQGYDIEPVFRIIAEMMMVMSGRQTARRTAERSSFWQSPGSNFGSDGALSLFDQWIIGAIDMIVLFLGGLVLRLLSARAFLLFVLVPILFSAFQIDGAIEFVGMQFSVPLIVGSSALPALILCAVLVALISCEQIKTLCLPALGTHLGFHKNASCQLGVSACV